MFIKRCISIIISLMLVITMPIAVFAEDPDPDGSVEAELEGYAQNAENAAKDAGSDLDDVIDSMNDAKDAMDELEQAVKNVEDALDSIDKKASEDAVDDAAGAVDDATDAVDNMPVDPDEDDVDDVNGLANDAKDAVGKATDAVNNDIPAIEDAAANAQDAVEKAKEITQMANEAVTAADDAIVSANEALGQAQLADEAYRNLLQEVVDGSATPSTYQALADAENAREAAWNKYTDAMNDAFGALEGAVQEVQAAQQAAKDAYDLWVAAESDMQNEADDAGFGALSELRTRAFEAAAASCNSALDAAITALELRGMAEAAQSKANDASNKANDAVTWQNDLRELVDTAIADLEKAVDDANKIIDAQNKDIEKKNALIEKENKEKQKEFEKTLSSGLKVVNDKGNSIKVHGLTCPDNAEVYLYIDDGRGGIAKIKLSTNNGNNWDSTKEFKPTSNSCDKIIISINGVYYEVPKSDSGNWNGNGTVNFEGDKLKKIINPHEIPYLDELEHLRLDGLGGPRGAEGFVEPDFETLKKLREILNSGQFGGLDIKVGEDPVPPVPPVPPTPPSYLGESEGGGGGEGGGGITIFDTPVPLAETPTVTIGDTPIPLAETPTVTIGNNPIPLTEVDTVTIIDEETPLTETPGSGGLLAMIASNIVTVDMYMPPVNRKGRRYIIKKICKK